MKILKKLGITLTLFAVCQLALAAVLHLYQTQYLPSQPEILAAIAYAKSSHFVFLSLSLAVFVCVVAPLSEEVIFRLSLSQIRFLPISLLCFGAVISAGYLLPFDLKQAQTIWLRVAWIVGATLILCHFFADKFELQAWQKFWQHKLALVVIFSFVFALLHLEWNQITGATSFALLLFPYLFLGIVISVVRIRIGFCYGVFYHLLNNLLAYLMALFA